MSIADLEPMAHTDIDTEEDEADANDAATTAETTVNDAPKGKRRWRTVFLVAVVMLLIAEAGARVLGTRLADPDWNVPELAAHINNVERITETEGGEIDTLIIGSSSPGAGFDPVELAEVSDSVGIAYNGNLFGPSMGAIRLVAENVLLDETDPEVVILGITSRALNDNSLDQSRMQDSLVTSVGWRRIEGTESSFDSLNQQAGKVSALVRYRPLLRDPETVARRLTSPVGPPVSDLGKLQSRDGKEYSLSGEHSSQERSALDNWAIDSEPSHGGPSEMDELRSLIETIEGQGRRLIVVEMPVLEEPWWNLHPKPAENRADYEAAIDELVADTGIEYWDINAEEAWTETDFGDPNHLNHIGAKRLSNLMADYLDQ